MKVQHEDLPHAVRLRIEGGLDAVSAPELRASIEALAASEPKDVELDLSGLGLIDSSGIGAIVMLFKRLRERDRELSVHGLHGQPRAVFELLRLDRVFRID